ncbi:hypothetical protein HD806DRAFT_520097 [Xylariaceae sp. AK1471]|nr:hypothetical protein HD806DRAFT_520097 [Xylariaceae sp. AK1471]
MTTTENVISCKDLADRQAEMLCRIRSDSPLTSNPTGDDNANAFFGAVCKVLEEHRTISDVLIRSIEGITESWLSPEAIEAKSQQSRLWKDLKDDLFKGQIEELKKTFQDVDRGLVVKGTRNKSASASVVGLLLATKRTAADIEELELGIAVWKESEVKALRRPRVSEEEVRKAAGDDYLYHYLLQCWGVNWAYMADVGFKNDKALVEYTKNVKEFWMIDTMGVLQGERGKGVGKRMIEEVKKRAEEDQLPIIVNANRDAVDFYKRCGFSTLGVFTYVGEENRENAIMQWVLETTDKGNQLGSLMVSS